MGIGQQKEQQGKMFLYYDEMPRSPGHVFYDRLQDILHKAKFDHYIEGSCRPYHAEKGRPSIPPGRYFRMMMVGYFEGFSSYREIAWRCADSLSLREFLQLGPDESVPDHSTLSRTHDRLPESVHAEMFKSVLGISAKEGLIQGRHIGVEFSTMEANAALRTIVRHDTGEGYEQMLARLAKEDGVETNGPGDLVRMDRKRKNKKLSNKEWHSPVDPDAKIAKLKDGRTHLAYKPEHAVDLDSGAVIAVKIHAADKGDVRTISETLEVAKNNLQAVTDTPPCGDDPADVVADKSHFSRSVLKSMDGDCWRSRIAEPKRNGMDHWDGDIEARRAVYNNRKRLATSIGKGLSLMRTEHVERCFAHTLDRGGMRRVWLRGTEKVEKRYLLHVAAFDLGVLMRRSFGKGTPRRWAGACIIVIRMQNGYMMSRFDASRRDDGDLTFILTAAVFYCSF